MTWPPQPQNSQSSWRPIRSIRSQLAVLLGNQQLIISMLQQFDKGQAIIMITTQDLQTKANAAAAANAELITLAKSQAQMLRDALSGGDPAAQQAAMQAVADTLDGITSADTAEVAADTVHSSPTPAPEPAPTDGSGAPPAP